MKFSLSVGYQVRAWGHRVVQPRMHSVSIKNYREREKEREIEREPERDRDRDRETERV